MLVLGLIVLMLLILLFRNNSISDAGNEEAGDALGNAGAGTFTAMLIKMLVMTLLLLVMLLQLILGMRRLEIMTLGMLGQLLIGIMLSIGVY